MNVSAKVNESINALYVEMMEHQFKTICFTSVDFKEGITTIASATAAAAASYGRHVLYCDFGNYNTSLTKRFDVHVDYKDGEPFHLSSNDILFIEALGFDLMPLPGPRPADISLISKESLEAFFHELKQKYELIFIDAHCYNKYQPHTLPARILTEVADVTVLIIQTGRVTLTEVKKVTEEMVEMSVNLLGFVMNDKNYPKLLDELCKESLRIDRYFPRVGKWIRKKMRGSVILNIEL